MLYSKRSSACDIDDSKLIKTQQYIIKRCINQYIDAIFSIWHSISIKNNQSIIDDMVGILRQTSPLPAVVSALNFSSPIKFADYQSVFTENYMLFPKTLLSANI